MNSANADSGCGKPPLRAGTAEALAVPHLQLRRGPTRLGATSGA
jgi:hypothetical protein